MNKLSTWHFLLVAWIALGVFLWKNYLCDCWSGNGTNKVLTKGGTGTWNINDGDSFSATANEHFKFVGSGANYIDALSSNLKNSIDETVAYLQKNPDKALIITGFYHANEKNNSLLPNLGMARANDIKGYLSSLGVSSKQLTLDAKLLTEKDWFVNDTLQKGIDFSFGKIENSNVRIEDIKNRLTGKPLTLYFAVNEKEINLNEQQRNDFADMIYYLDNVSDSKLDIAGHTDNSGKAAVNDFISGERAKFVATYLEENGNISREKIKSAGFGSRKPIVTNTTKENKALNRRVEVILVP